VSYLHKTVKKFTQGNRWDLHTYDNLKGGAYPNYHFSDLKEMNQPEALLFLFFLLKHQVDIRGAIEIQASRQILFQIQGVNFILSYENHPIHRPILCKAPAFALDINQGFILLDENKESKIHSIQGEKLISALQKKFIMWKNNNYIGSLFPESEIINHNIDQKINEAHKEISGISTLIDSSKTMIQSIKESIQQDEIETNQNFFSNSAFTKNLLFFSSVAAAGAAIIGFNYLNSTSAEINM
jgi:hypothetical protein